ncbi:lamin tail domain-containing protein [Brachybacterium huguangmaarense]
MPAAPSSPSARIARGAVLLGAGALALAPALASVVIAPPAQALPTGDATVAISEVSRGKATGDWVELTNAGTVPVDVSGWVLRDDDDTHAWSVPQGTTLAPGGYLVLDGVGQDPAGFTFALGKADAARIYLADGTTLVDSLAWTNPATATYMVCGTEVLESGAATKGAANPCPAPPVDPTDPAGPTDPADPPAPASSPLVISESASSGDDFVELHNPSAAAVDASGYVVKDSEDSHVMTIPAGTSIPPGGYLLITSAQLGYGLGGADAVRLFAPGGALVDHVEWTEHAVPSLGLCGTERVVQAAATPGAANDCTPAPTEDPGTALPTTGAATTADAAGQWPGDLSGLDLQGAGAEQILWGVSNATGQLSRLVRGADGAWHQSAGWPATGKQLRFPNGTGEPDAEGVSVGGDGRIYVAAERDNAVKGTSRNTVLRFDASAPGTELTAQTQWDLTAVLPATGANAGIEAIEIVPASALAHVAPVSGSDGAVYAFVALEATGDVYAVELRADGTASLLATLDSPLPGLMALDYDASLNRLWAFCDEACDGRSVQYDLSATTVTASGVIARAEGLANVANEGVAIEPSTACADGGVQAWFADDAATDGHSIRGARLARTCPVVEQPGTGGTTTPAEPSPGQQSPGDPGQPAPPAPGSGAAAPTTGASTGTGTAVTPSETATTTGTTARTHAGRTSLARTGAEALPYALAAAGLVLVGWGLTRLRRPRG